MTKRTYGQYCGIARGLELVGERWAMLIVRDMLTGTRRYTDLQRGLSGIPTNVLASRLRELENAGVIRRRVTPRPDSGAVYELTPFGRELEDILLRLGRWGAQALPAPEDETGYVDPAIRALRASFNPEKAVNFEATFEVWFGSFVLHVTVSDGSVDVDEGRMESADIVIDVRGSIIPVLQGTIAVNGALEDGRIRFDGPPDLLERFFAIFRMDPRTFRRQR